MPVPSTSSKSQMRMQWSPASSWLPSSRSSTRTARSAHRVLGKLWALHQKEIVGLYRSMCLLRPSASPAQLQLVLDCMRYVCRDKLDTTFVDECKIMVPVWDEGLLCCLKSFKKRRESPQDWWGRYKDNCYKKLCDAGWFGFWMKLGWEMSGL